MSNVMTKRHVEAELLVSDWGFFTATDPEARKLVNLIATFTDAAESKAYQRGFKDATAAPPHDSQNDGDEQ